MVVGVAIWVSKMSLPECRNISADLGFSDFNPSPFILPRHTAAHSNHVFEEDPGPSSPVRRLSGRVSEMLHRSPSDAKKVKKANSLDRNF